MTQGLERCCWLLGGWRGGHDGHSQSFVPPGFMRADDRPEKLPNFLAQETGGMHEYLNLLFRLYSYQGGGGGDGGGRSVDGAVVEWDRHELAEERIRSLCELLVAEFVKKETVVSTQALVRAAPFSSSGVRMFRLSACR